jgi:hypothetical protein
MGTGQQMRPKRGAQKLMTALKYAFRCPFAVRYTAEVSMIPLPEEVHVTGFSNNIGKGYSLFIVVAQLLLAGCSSTSQENIKTVKIDGLEHLNLPFGSYTCIDQNESFSFLEDGSMSMTLGLGGRPLWPDEFEECINNHQRESKVDQRHIDANRRLYYFMWEGSERQKKFIQYGSYEKARDAEHRGNTEAFRQQEEKKRQMEADDLARRLAKGGMAAAQIRSTLKALSLPFDQVK